MEKKPCYGCALHQGPKDGEGNALPTEKFFCQSSEGSEKPPGKYMGTICGNYEPLDRDFPFEHDGAFHIIR
jgi:hypothetical protein